MVRGKLNKQIAYELGTSERTVKAHRQAVMHKLNVQSLAESRRDRGTARDAGHDRPQQKWLDHPHPPSFLASPRVAWTRGSVR